MKIAIAGTTSCVWIVADAFDRVIAEVTGPAQRVRLGASHEVRNH